MWNGDKPGPACPSQDLEVPFRVQTTRWTFDTFSSFPVAGSNRAMQLLRTNTWEVPDSLASLPPLSASTRVVAFVVIPRNACILRWPRVIATQLWLNCAKLSGHDHVGSDTLSEKVVWFNGGGDSSYCEL